MENRRRRMRAVDDVGPPPGMRNFIPEEGIPENRMPTSDIEEEMGLRRRDNVDSMRKEQAESGARGREMPPRGRAPGMKKGGAVKKMASGGAVKKMAAGGVAASKRADGCAMRGKTRGRMV
jgi:hypothetical protein